MDQALVLISATEAKLLAQPVAASPNLTVAFAHLALGLPRRVVLAALQCGRCYFGALRARGDLSSSGPTSSLGTFQLWSRARFVEFVEAALRLLHHDSPEVQVAALLSVLEFTGTGNSPAAEPAPAPAATGSGGSPSGERSDLLAQVLSSLACLPVVSDALLEAVHQDLFQATARVRSLRAVVKAIEHARHDVLSGHDVEGQADAFVTLLCLVEMPSNASALADETAGAGDDDQSSDSGSESDDDGTSERKRKRAKKGQAVTTAADRQFTRLRRTFESAWLACLKLPMRPQTYKRVLLRLPESIMPHLPSPLKLADFLTDGYELGGLNSVLALSGLFILMRVHNLDYPKFYDSLYGTLTPAVFFSKYRSRYFRLLNLCLSSANLPAYVVAAFLKKLNRLALGAPPTGAIYILALTKNLLQKHSAALTLIRKKETAEGPATDSFVATASTPLDSQALGSSLWELHALKAHYHPGVSVLCKELERKWDKHEAKLPMNEYTSQTYRQLFDLETQRKTKTTPLSYQKPMGGLFGGEFHCGVFSTGA